MLAAQSCPLCDRMDCGPPGSSVPGILQAGILECVAIPFSKGSSWTWGIMEAPAYLYDLYDHFH